MLILHESKAKASPYDVNLQEYATKTLNLMTLGPKPGKDDKSFTSDLLINMKSLGVKFYGHIISDGEYYSFAEHGLMDRF